MRLVFLSVHFASGLRRRRKAAGVFFIDLTAGNAPAGIWQRPYVAPDQTHEVEMTVHIKRKISGAFAALAVALACVASATAQTASKRSGEEVTWPSVVCRGAQCEPITAKGWLFAKPGQTGVVIVSHGSIGVDYRVFDRADHLQSAGYAALVVDHWGPRGIGEVLSDLVNASSKGASDFNIALDTYTAASWLRRERDFEKVGAIGASFGGGAQAVIQQRWAMQTIEKTYEYHYKKPFVARPLDAQVGLYGFCGYRNKVRDAFNGAPLLLINGDKDEMDPAAMCEKFVPWMNERGGKVKQVTLKGHYHSFDAREPATYSPRIVHTGKCDLLQDEKGVTDQATGEFAAGTGVEPLLAVLKKCGTAWGATNGHSGDPNVAVPLWLAFFKEHM
jgi:dienelactone hydrolase